MGCLNNNKIKARIYACENTNKFPYMTNMIFNYDVMNLIMMKLLIVMVRKRRVERGGN